MNVSHLLKYLLILAISLPLSIHAELDAVQSRMLKPYELPLRWDNIEQSPQWLGGIEPVRKKESRLHVLHLAPNEWVEVRVEAGEILRVLGTQQPLDPESLHVLVSNGTGLYAEPVLQKTADHKNWLTQTDKAAIYRLENVSNVTEPIEIALFASRHAPLGELAPYRQLLDLPTQEVALHQSFEAAPQRYWKLDKNQEVNLNVEGPRRLVLENRLHYPLPESRMLQSWHISAWLDDYHLHTAEMESNAETLQEILADNVSVMTSRKERMYLDIPEGQHRLRLQSTAPLYARLLQQDSTDYSFPALNQPRLPAEIARNDLDPRKAGQTTWLIPDEELQQATETPLEAPDTELTALRLAMDNRWREGGLAGAGLLGQSAQIHPGDQSLQIRADYFAGAHTFFRDILPQDKQWDTDMTYRWFRLPRLSELGKEDRNLVAVPQHQQDLLDHLGAGYFVTLPAKSDTPNPVPASAAKHHPAEQVRELVLFKNDSSRITDVEQKKLQLLAKRWHETGGQLLEIHGHTDSNAGLIYNQKLSERRADAVLRALTALGVRATIVNIAAFGKTNPIADNSTSAGRQQNRRVEITMQRPMEKTMTTIPAPQMTDVALYQLPEAYAPRTLRIAAYGNQEAEFFVQIDQHPIRRLRFSPANQLPLEAFPPTQGDGGLLLQQLAGDVHNEGTQNATFARTRVAAPMVAAGIIELALPAKGREVRLWRTADADNGLHVAVQYQASAAFQLSEHEFLALHRLNQDSGLPLREALLKQLPAEGSPGNDLLASQWRPLVRLLTNEYRQAKAGVRPQQQYPFRQPIDTTSTAQRASAAEATGQWLLALEQWSKLWFSSSPETLRKKAEWGRINALHHLGEDFMFEQMLKQILFFDEDTARRAHAFALLEEQYRSSHDDEALLRLHAIAVQQFNDLSYWYKLTQSLMDNGEFRLALLTGLAMPPEQRPDELLLQASWRLNWWDTFDQLRVNLKVPERQAFWLGMQAAAQNKLDAASGLFQTAGVAGQTYVRHIDDGLAIRNKLESISSVDAETYWQWLQWQAGVPGPRTWRDASESVKDFAGALPGYAIDRDLHFSLYKANADRPLQLKVTGPAKLRLEVRPIHPSMNTAPLEGWITAQSTLGLWVAPIIANQPTEGLQMAEGTIVGRKVLLEIPVAAGPQTFSVHAGNLPIAVRVYTEQPTLPIGILHTPPFTDADDQQSEHIVFEEDTHAEKWLNRCNGCLTVPEANQLHPFKYYRMKNRPIRTINPQPTTEIVLVAATNSVDVEAQLLANKEYESLLNSIPVKSDQPDLVLKRMTLLLRIAETAPQHYEKALAIGHALASANTQVDGISRLLNRLSRSSGWSALETVQESAGVRLLPISGWQPESPSSRTQKALLPPLAENEQVISGTARMVLSLLNNQPGKVDFDLRAEELGGLPPQPLQVAVQRDNDPVRIITLAPDTGWQAQSIHLASGRHALRFSIRNPIANQMLRIRLKERHGQPIMNQFERAYQIATAQQPLRAMLQGPAWLRIDEWHDNQTQSRYQYLTEPWQTITLIPDDDREEALYRLHIRSFAPAQAPVQPRNIATETAPVPIPPIQINDANLPATIRLVDEFKLGTQEDGTWTFAEEAHSRYDIDSHGKEKYLESSLSYRYFDEARQTYYNAQGLLRLHQHGNPTIGIKLRADHHPWGMAINAFAEVNAYAQTIPLAGNHWSVNLKAGISQQRNIDPKTWHTPWLTAHAYKVGTENTNNPERVDQDIYTLYKSQHRFGYVIGDKLTYRPRLDTLLSASASVTSNENLITPDKLGINVEIRQLLGKWQADAHLTQTHYFKDSDRDNVTNRSEFGVGLSREFWTGKLDRAELLLHLNHNLQSGESAGWLGLRWNFDNGRGYRDFRPGEIDFRDLRERNIPNQPNNRIETVNP